MSEQQTPEQPEPRDEPVPAPEPVDVQDDEAAEPSRPATLDDQDNGANEDSAPATEGAPNGEERRSDSGDSGSAEQ